MIQGIERVATMKHRTVEIIFYHIIAGVFAYSELHAETLEDKLDQIMLFGLVFTLYFLRYSNSK